MKILYLTIKAKWYDMIEAGIKPEEYREIKDFWIKRLVDSVEYELGFRNLNATVKMKPFTHVCFARGGHFHKSIPQMTIELNSIVLGYGKEDWGAEPNEKYFVIKLGEKLPQNTPQLHKK